MCYNNENEQTNHCMYVTHQRYIISEFILAHCFDVKLGCMCLSCTYSHPPSMEVGVCAEAYKGGEPLRHINSAFMTFEVLDGDRKPCMLPRIRPEPVVSWENSHYFIFQCNKS